MGTPAAAVIDSVPPPERLRDDIADLHTRLRLTRALLKLSERIHSGAFARKPAPSSKQEMAHAS